MLTAANAAAQKTLLSLVKGDVGLENVDNTSDANKPVSTAQQTALNAKQATLVSGTNIKTVNSSSLLGSGDLAISGLSGTGSVDNAVLRADGTGGATLQNSAIVIDDLFTASPNNTVNFTCLKPTGGTTNVGLAIVPKGTGAFTLAVPDGTAAGGNARGANAIDLQTSRGAASQVASGANSIVIGVSNVAVGDSNIAIGNANAANNYDSVAIGKNNTGGFGGVAIGWSNSATTSGVAMGQGCSTSSGVSMGQGCASSSGIALGEACSSSAAAYGQPTGVQAVANKHGQRAMSSGRFSANGDAQISELIVRNATSNATQTELLLNGSSLRITIGNDTTWAFDCLIVARRTDADNESAAYRITGCIDRNTNAASTALVGSPTVTVISEDNAAWDVDAVADTANGSLNIRVTGEAGKSIRWVGLVRLAEVTG
jgi:hypothetical protein